jgi:uncharacterized membrane protein YjgN (DUF898 family)
MSVAPTATSPAAGPRRWSFTFRGSGGDLFGILLVNVLLTFVTLGLYYPWARVRELRFMIGNVDVARDAFEFHGTGGQMFLGFLLAWVAIFLPLVVANFVFSLAPEGGTGAIVMLLFYAFLLVFIPVALAGSARYRLKHTSWRGIRFGFDGTPWQFAAGFIPRLLLVIVTLGLAYPVFACWRRTFMISHARFGTQPLSIDVRPEDLFGRFVVAWLLFAPTFGFSGAWFYGEMLAYFWNRTRIGGAQFHCSLTGGQWVVMQIKNALLTLFTLGLYAPWARVGLEGLLVGSLSVDDTLDLAAIRQGAGEASAFGEGAADLLDVDSGLGIG